VPVLTAQPKRERDAARCLPLRVWWLSRWESSVTKWVLIWQTWSLLPWLLLKLLLILVSEEQTTRTHSWPRRSRARE
jgi:hypothetical protein